MTKPTGRPNGRPLGRRNNATLAREKEIDKALEKAKAKANVDPIAAMVELYKYISICQGMAARFRPENVTTVNGVLQILGGDIDRFGDWMDRYFKGIRELLPYQNAVLKATDKPSDPPDPEQVMQDSKIVFGLRVFEGGRQVDPLQPLYDEDEEDE